ncbi:hypothetical protein [Leptolyngbya ohadii]|nr:hypothetical protein [Leptolyngbya ohadii]
MTGCAAYLPLDTTDPSDFILGRNMKTGRSGITLLYGVMSRLQAI